MPQTDSFAELMRQVRAGDAEATEQLWRQYEPLLRREIRLRLRDPRLRQHFDENDVCQSVMASFFVRAAAGQYELDGPEQLRHLLVRMGQNKLASQARRERAQRRDCRRAEHVPDPDGAVAGKDTSPSQAAEWRELLQRFRERLSEEERRLADLRAQDTPWADIVAQMGGTVDGRRVQLNRAIARVSQELGLEGTDDD